MSESFSPLNRFFSCSVLKPFSEDEIARYIQNQLSLVDVKIDASALTFISKKSEGHPYVLVAMCFMIFDSLRESDQKITEQIVINTQEKMYLRLAQDFFSPMMHPLTPKGKTVLQSIVKNVDGTEFNFKEAIKWTGMPRNHVSPYIHEMMRKGILNKLERGRYQIFHGLFADYIREMATEVARAAKLLDYS